MSYKQKMGKVEEAVTKLQGMEDVDEAIQLYESTSELLRQCEETIEKAKGRFEEMTASK